MKCETKLDKGGLRPKTPIRNTIPLLDWRHVALGAGAAQPLNYMCLRKWPSWLLPPRKVMLQLCCPLLHTSYQSLSTLDVSPRSFPMDTRTRYTRYIDIRYERKMIGALRTTTAVKPCTVSILSTIMDRHWFGAWRPWQERDRLGK